MLSACGRIEQIESSVSADARQESNLVRVAVLPAEAVPRHVEVEDGEVREEAVARDGMPRPLEPEEDGFAGRHLLEGLGRGGRPEVHLVDDAALRLIDEEVEPCLVGQGDEGGGT